MCFKLCSLGMSGFTRFAVWKNPKPTVSWFCFSGFFFLQFNHKKISGLRKLVLRFQVFFVLCFAVFLLKTAKKQQTSVCGGRNPSRSLQWRFAPLQTEPYHRFVVDRTANSTDQAKPLILSAHIDLDQGVFWLWPTEGKKYIYKTDEHSHLQHCVYCFFFCCLFKAI